MAESCANTFVLASVFLPSTEEQFPRRGMFPILRGISQIGSAWPGTRAEASQPPRAKFEPEDSMDLETVVTGVFQLLGMTCAAFFAYGG